MIQEVQALTVIQEVQALTVVQEVQALTQTSTKLLNYLLKTKDISNCFVVLKCTFL